MKKLSLTFDDGPNGPCTDALLDVLSRHGVLATFFVIQSRSLMQSVLAKRIERRGHAVENHGYTHRDLRGLSWSELELEIGGWGKYFRPPGGHYDDGLLNYLSFYGIEMVLWVIDSFDYCLKTADEICAVVDEQMNGEDAIILLHDGDSTKSNGDRWATVEATDRIITKYKAQGYEFVSLDQMTLPGTPRRTSL
jgi:peptidoglycan/xylan/chitin deacetylase (PgdA/CDA1 family)